MTKNEAFQTDLAAYMTDVHMLDLAMTDTGHREPDQEPDPEFAHMSIDERNDALDEWAMEEGMEYAEREFIKRYPGIL